MNYTPLNINRLFDNYCFHKWYLYDYLHFLYGSLVFMVIIDFIILKRIGIL